MWAKLINSCCAIDAINIWMLALKISFVVWLCVVSILCREQHHWTETEKGRFHGSFTYGYCQVGQLLLPWWFQSWVWMHTDMFALNKMKDLTHSRNDKDWLPLRSHYSCFLCPVYLPESESCWTVEHQSYLGLTLLPALLVLEASPCAFPQRALLRSKRHPCPVPELTSV